MSVRDACVCLRASARVRARACACACVRVCGSVCVRVCAGLASDRHDRLERRAELDPGCIHHDVDAEPRPVEHALPHRPVLRRAHAQRRLAEASRRHLGGDVCPHQHRDVEAEQVAPHALGDERRAAVDNVEPLDQRAHAAVCSAAHQNFAKDLAVQKLVRNGDDHERGERERRGEIGLGDDRVRHLDARQVLCVLVLFVDRCGERGVVHPELHERLKLGPALGVLRDELGDGGAPRAAADDADSVHQLAVDRHECA